MNSLGVKSDTCSTNRLTVAPNAFLRSRPICLLAGLAALLLGSSLHAATLTRTSSFTYDANTGLLLTETIEPDDASLRLNTTYTYDAFGNKISATVSGSNITSRTTTTTYDVQGRFPVSASNALGHTETRVFDERFGTATQVTGPNGLVSNFAFDTWGRPTTESGPDGVVTTTTRGTCPATGCPGLAAYYVTVSKPGAPTATAYFDKFNRQLRTQSVGFDGTNVLKDTVYNNLGQVYQVSRPYYSGAAIVYTTYSYDLLNRVTTTTDPQGNQSTVVYSGFSTTVTNANGQTSVGVKNSQGQLVSATDALTHTLSYTYDPFGNLLTTTDPAGNVTALTYDLRGRKTGMNDLDMGVWSYTYDVLGELVTQTDAKGQVTTNTYDVLGRMTHRAEPDLNTNWYYDTVAACNSDATMAIGKIVCSTTDNNQTRSFHYDSLGRLVDTDTQNGIGSPTLVVNVGYDSLGRVATRTTPAGFQMQNTYNASGYLSQVQSVVTSVFPVEMSWTATALSADGQLSAGTFGNGVTETRTIDNLGRTTAVNATHPTLGAATILGYTYDPLGNLTIRTDTTQNLIENYSYDALNRITGVTSSNPNQAAKTYAYDALGNLTSKSDTGTYTYNSLRANGTNRPHAVSSIAGSWNTSFTYDDNGSVVSGGDRTYVYTSFNLPASITRNVPSNGTESILYGADHERAQITEPDGTVEIQLNPRLDSGTHYDQLAHPNGVTEDVNYFYADNRPIGIYSINANGANGVNTVRYFHVDAQGSIVAITSGDTANAGTVVERLSYDAWGKRRNADGTDDSTNNLQGANTDHGYTGQEHLDTQGLIHMSGRVYDPRLGRFLQADPFIQSPGNLQSYNRYSYVMNNPFFYTDPSGYLSLSDFDPSHAIKQIGSSIGNFTVHIVNVAGNIPGIGGLLQVGLLASPMVGLEYGFTTGNWNAVGRAVETSAVIAATYWAGGAAAAAFDDAAIGSCGAAYVSAGTYATAAGVYVSESAAIGYVSTYTTARIYGASDDQAQHAALLGAKRAAGMATERVLVSIPVANRGQSVSDTSDGTSIAKPAGTDVAQDIGSNASNTGLSYTGAPPTGILRWVSEDSPVFKWLSGNVNGVQGASTAHDIWMGGLTRGLSSVFGSLGDGIGSAVTVVSAVPTVASIVLTEYGGVAVLNVKPIQ